MSGGEIRGKVNDMNRVPDNIWLEVKLIRFSEVKVKDRLKLIEDKDSLRIFVKELRLGFLYDNSIILFAKPSLADAIGKVLYKYATFSFGERNLKQWITFINEESFSKFEAYDIEWKDGRIVKFRGLNLGGVIPDKPWTENFLAYMNEFLKVAEYFLSGDFEKAAELFNKIAKWKEQ